MCPFINDEQRAKLHADKPINVLLSTETVPGNKCFLFYREMIRRWKEVPRWLTAHDIYKNVKHRYCANVDDREALELAWQVFFHLHVMPYEIKKRKEYGEVE